MAKYYEICRLHLMLSEAGIPHQMNSAFDGWQVLYFQGEKRVCSAIEHYGSYGHQADRIEIMGLLTEEESQEDSVLGWLTAEEVFKRIRSAHQKYLQSSRSITSCIMIGAGGEVWSGSMPSWD